MYIIENTLQGETYLADFEIENEGMFKYIWTSNPNKACAFGSTMNMKMILSNVLSKDFYNVIEVELDDEGHITKRGNIRKLSEVLSQ